MPRVKGGGHGNELVSVRIVMPADLRPEERELYEKLKALRSESPRGGYAQG
jgi:curved DNA-binding protein